MQWKLYFYKTLTRSVVTSTTTASNTCNNTIVQNNQHQKLRQGFGSFHADDIEYLIRLPNNAYKPPTLWSEQNKLIQDEIIRNGSIEFGKDFKKHYFYLDNKWTFLNHGAFGAVIQPIFQQASNWRKICEQQPLKFIDRELLPLIAHTVRTISTYLHCPADEILPLQNVTSGLNSIINNFPLHQNDEVICLNLTYGSTKKILAEKCLQSKAHLKIVNITFPIQSIDMLIHEITSEISKNTKLIILDHITSNTALELPILEIAKRCKEIQNIFVIVDAAHSLFSQQVKFYSNNNIVNDNNISNQSLYSVVDVWLSNGHKWLCAPKGCAFMWINPNSSVASFLKPAIISHGYSPSSNTSSSLRLLSGFAWDGCRDYAAILSVPSTLQFWDEIGENNVREYNRNLVHQASDLLRYEWQIRDNDRHCPLSMIANLPMLLVPLPDTVLGISTRSNCTDKEAFYIQEYLHNEKAIEVPIKHINGQLYARLSAHVYNDIQDYQRLAHAFK